MDALRAKIRDFCLPVNDKIMKANNFFSLYPFDGGGYFITNDIIGGVTDADFCSAILEKGALDDCGEFPKLDFGRFERWRSIEKSCWLNRFYFVVPLAKKFWTDGDEHSAKMARDAIMHFVETHVPPHTDKEIVDHFQRVMYNRDENYNKKSFEERQKDDTDVEYIWFDFQPASRVIHFLYALHFLADFEGLTDTDIERLVESLREHARVIMVGERDADELHEGNHQALRGLALLYAYSFFKDEEWAEELLTVGRRVINYHIEEDFFPDGVMREISPSYHMFETWHVRDSLSMAELHGFSVCAEAEDVLEGAASLVESSRQPDGYSVTIDDGYPLNIYPFQQTLPKLSSRERSVNGHVLPNAGLAQYCDDRFYLFYDVSPFTGEFSHYHAGKQAVSLWYYNQPFLVDSGCCSYDDENFSSYKQAEAHSSLLVNGQGDGILNGTYSWPHYATPSCESDWRAYAAEHLLKSNLTSNAPEWHGLVWQRRLRMVTNEKLEINDVLEFSGEKEFTFVFNLHPDVTVSKEHADYILENEESLRFFASASADGQVEMRPGMVFEKGEHRENTRLCFTFKASSKATFKTIISEY